MVDPFRIIDALPWHDHAAVAEVFASKFIPIHTRKIHIEVDQLTYCILQK